MSELTIQVRHFIRMILRSNTVMLCLMIGLLGCLGVYQTTFNTEYPFFFVLRQLTWLILGVGVLVGASLIPIERYERWTPHLAGLGLALLYAVLLFGVRRNGMRGWFELRLFEGQGLFHVVLVQPSEIFKPVYVLFLAWLWRKYGEAGDFSARAYLLQLGGGLPWFLALVLQPDFGTLLIYLLVFGILYWMQGGRLRYLGYSVLAGVPFVLLACRIYPYLYRRLAGFFHPQAFAESYNWQAIQFHTALARGGLWGRPLRDAVWSRHYLPLSYSDSIFAALAEVLGFFGVMVILAGIGIWFAYGMYHARRGRSQYQALVIIGLTCILGVQALVHVSVTCGVMPATGVTFPFFSYGGSSLLATMASIGILLSIQRGRQTVEAASQDAGGDAIQTDTAIAAEDRPDGE